MINKTNMKIKIVLFLILHFATVILLFSQEKDFKCIDEKGNVLFEFKARFVWPFSNDMALFKTTVPDETNTKLVWRAGFINGAGEVVIPAIYDSKYSTYYGFVDGVSWIRNPGEEYFYLIDKSGVRISEKTYAKVGSFNEGMCAVYEDDKMGFINSSGVEVIPCKYIGDSWFYDGLVCVMDADAKEEQFGFINKNGDIVIPFQFYQAGYSGFVNGEARVVINGKTCLINLAGEVVFTPLLTNNCDNFYDGLSLAYVNPDRSGFGFYDRNSQWVVEPIYDHVTSFKGGRSIVEKDGKLGVIDTTGKYIVPIEYVNVYGDCESHGLFIAVKDNISYFFNCDGEHFTDKDVKYIFGSNSGQLHPFSSKNGKMGYLRKDGSVFIEAIYINTEPFSEGKAWVY